MDVPDLRISELEFPTSKAMRMLRYVRPRGDYILKLLQAIHTPHTPLAAVFDAGKLLLDSATDLP
jgi:hypothetical protein